MVRLKIAYEKANIRFKTWHCLRRTRGNELFEETGDRELAKMWLGHGSNKVFERYNHTYEALVRTSKRTRLKKGERFDDWFFGENEKRKGIIPENITEGKWYKHFQEVDWNRELPEIDISIALT